MGEKLFTVSASLERNRSLTNEEINAFWRSKKETEDDHLRAISNLSKTIQVSLTFRSLPFLRISFVFFFFSFVCVCIGVQIFFFKLIMYFDVYIYDGYWTGQQIRGLGEFSQVKYTLGTDKGVLRHGY